MKTQKLVNDLLSNNIYCHFVKSVKTSWLDSIWAKAEVTSLQKSPANFLATSHHQLAWSSPMSPMAWQLSRRPCCISGLASTICIYYINLYYILFYKCMCIYTTQTCNGCLCVYVYIYIYINIHIYTSSTAQGGGGSFKNRKPINRRDWLLWITDGRANPLMDRKVVGAVFFGVAAMVAVVTWSVASPTTAGCSVV